jgi:hypothetical protein
MKKDRLRFISILVLTIVLAGCGSSPTPPKLNGNVQAMTPTRSDLASAPSSTTVSTSSASSTPDPCSAGQIEAEVQKVHRHMREFDDASVLASKLPRDQLTDSVADLQRIRREAEDEQVPTCLTNLRKYQVDHMNSVISTLLVFIGGTDTTTLEQGIAIARQQHDQYTLELARLLGLTVVPATPVTGTPGGTATP